MLFVSNCHSPPLFLFLPSTHCLWGQLDTRRCLVGHGFQHVIDPIIFNNNALAPADLAQLGRPLALPGAEEVVGVLQAAREDLAHVAAVAVGAQLLVAVGQHLRHGRVRGLRGGTSSARVPARGGQGQRRWGRGWPAGDGPRGCRGAGAGEWPGRDTAWGRSAQPARATQRAPAAELRCARAPRASGCCSGRRAGLTSSALSGAGRGPSRAGPRRAGRRVSLRARRARDRGGRTPGSARAGPAAGAGGGGSGDSGTGKQRAAEGEGSVEEGGQGEETRREGGGREETERATGRKTERQKKARGAAGGGRVRKEGEKEKGGD